MNSYESGSHKCIPATLIYLRNASELLMLRRKSKNSHSHFQKYNGIGGKFEPGENPLQAAQRECWEESGLRLSLDRFHCLGHLYFPNFKEEKKEDWSVHVFVADLTLAEREQVLTENGEGFLEWISESDVLNFPMWEGDKEFLPFVLKRQSFWGSFSYRGQKLESFFLQPL